MSDNLENPKYLHYLLKREARWLCLEQLHQAQWQGISQRVIEIAIITDRKINLSPKNITNILIELKHRGYCTTEQLTSDLLHITITPSGIDLVEYNAECPQAINRPSL